MGSGSLPSPPAEDHKSTLSRKSTSSSTKSVKPVHRTSKRASSSAATIHHHDHVTHTTGMDGRHKRFTYTQCNSYAEVLENTQFALIATVHKLYSMVRNNQSWNLGEPELNDRGQPVIHNIAQKLGCIRPNSDIDLPVHSVFPEDEAGMAELARQLEDQQKEHEPHKEAIKDTDSSQQQSGMMANMDMLNQGLVESEFGTIKPHVLSCPNPEVMLGMGDPMIYSGYDGEPMRL
ncbi:hypothetical protein FG05_08502 [Fusarium graminearum]|nr:hypothetical protein FG05_08502 [Fusarium graminearum]